MSAKTPYVSQQTLDNLASQIRRGGNWRNHPDDRTRNIAHTVLWEKIASYIEIAPVDQVLGMIASGAIPATDKQMGSPLGLAAEKHRSDLIEPLVAAGCPINAVGAEDMTPLEHALANTSDSSNGDTVRILLKLGAVGFRSESVLNYAAYCGHPHNVAAFLDHGFNPNEPCPVEGTTALVTSLQELTIGERMVETVKLLLQRGADPTQPSGQIGYTDRFILPIDALAAQSDDDVTEDDLDQIMGLMQGLNLTPDDFLTACARSATPNDELALCALKRGARPHPEVENDPTKETIFQKFAIKGMAQSVQFMLEHCSEAADQLSPNGTPLIELVADEDTLVALRSHRTHDSIVEALSAGENDAHALGRSRSALSL